jgi:hypothetical protein
MATNDLGSVSGGAVNDDAEATIRKHLPSSLAGRAWDALIAALAVGDRLNWENAKLAFDQLFKISASGIYLDRRAADDGLIRPPDIGMSDDLFRQLAIKTTNTKLTQELLLEILEIFYGADAVRAHVSTDLVEPFSLADGQTLDLLLDERDLVIVSFSGNDFQNISQATAREVAAAINRDFQRNSNKSFAVEEQDPSTGLIRVKIYSGSLGLGSFVRVIGGSAQPALEFPAKLDTYNDAVVIGDSYTWAVTSPDFEINRVALDRAATGNKINLSLVEAGDYVIFGAGTSSIPAGIYEILNVEVSSSGSNLIQAFEINATAADHTFIQASNSKLQFFRPSKASIGDSRTAVVAQVLPGIVNVKIPATTQAVSRGVNTASYPHDSEHLAIESLTRIGNTVKVITDESHGLTVGQSILVEEASGSPDNPTITAGDPSTSGNPGTSDASIATIWTQLRTQDVQGTQGHASIRLNDGRVLITGGFSPVSSVNTAIDDCQHFAVTGSSTLGSGAKQYTYNWTAAASLPTARDRHGISILTNDNNLGDVLVTGGYDEAVCLSATARYTPDGGSGSWIVTDSMATARRLHSQTTLANDLVLVAGGDDGVNALDSCELYDPDADSWGAAGSMIVARTAHQAIVLDDNRILVIGGQSQLTASTGTLHNTCEIYDPGTDTWTSTGSMAYARVGHAAIVMSDGRVLVCGGRGYVAAGGDTIHTLNSVEVYDPNTGQWFSAPSMGSSRSGHGVVALSTKNLLMVSGGGAQKPEYFDPRKFEWRYIPNPLTNTDVTLSQSLTLVGTSDLVLLHGGFKDDETTAPAYLYQLAEDVFAAGGLNGVFVVTATPSSTEFWYETPEFNGLTVNQNQSLTVRKMAALSGSSISGPFVLDPLNGIAVTAIESEVTMDLVKNQQYRQLGVADSSQFPDAPGWLVVGFGTDTVVYPIRYFGRLGATALSIDYSFRFPNDNLVSKFTVSQAQRSSNVTTLTLNLPAGITDHGLVVDQVIYFKSSSISFSVGYKTIVSRTSTTISFADPGSNTTVVNPGSAVVKGPRAILLKQKGPWAPTHPETAGLSYLTASSSGRVAAVKALGDAVAAGIELDVEIVYPSDLGLAGAGLPISGQQRLSDNVVVWGGDNLTEEVDAARES